MNNAQHEPRVMMTTRLWAFAVALMALSVPMIGIERDMAVLPIMIMIGTTISTVVVWRSGSKRSDEMAMLAHSIRELQQQLARQQITSSDDDLKRKIEELSVR
jgi:hypothetical protein